jgi:hypothetical protein
MEFGTFLLYFLLKRSVMLLFLVGAIIFGIARWKRHSRISAMAVFALALYLINSLTFGILFHLVPEVLISLHVTTDSIIILEDVLMLGDDFIYSAVLILLVAAAFSRRAPATALNHQG